jgi:large subunit ribosomal protein L16
MLMPKKTKYRKSQRGRNRGKARSGNKLSFGSFGLIALGGCLMNQREIEAARRALTRYIKRGGKVWIRVFPDKVMTKIPAETRMGKGKGAPEFWVAVVKPGHVVFELSGVTEEIAREALRLAAHKFSIKTKFIKKEIWD